MKRAILRQLAMAAALAVLTATQTPQIPYRPKFPGDPARSEAEASALGYMRTVLYAQRMYRQKKGGYAGSLYALVGSGSFTKRMTKTDRGDYLVSFGGGRSGFALLLTPKQFDSTHRAFYTDASGVLRYEDEKPATADSPVLKPEHPESEPAKPSSNDSAAPK
ncbi:MAG: hypothetical protein ACRD2K_00980 [Terriglobales bacterium]